MRAIAGVVLGVCTATYDFITIVISLPILGARGQHDRFVPIEPVFLSG